MQAKSEAKKERRMKERKREESKLSLSNIGGPTSQGAFLVVKPEERKKERKKKKPGSEEPAVAGEPAFQLMHCNFQPVFS